MTRSAVFAISALILLSFSLVFASCKGRIDIPTEFPTPEPPPKSTPLPKIEFKPDSELATQIAKIAEIANGKVGVAAVVVETGQFAGLNAEQQFPMQSVYKLPIAMAVMEQIKRGELAFEEKIGVSKDDMVRAGQRSPLRDANPNGGEFTINELIRLSLVESDGTASDVLMRVAGGAVEIQAFLTQIGIRDIKVANSEKEIGGDWETQYQNWATPVEATVLLQHLFRQAYPDGNFPTELGDTVTQLQLLMGYLAESNTGPKRLKGELPKGTVVAHKTGTSGTQNGITAATNDIGIITLPNGKHLAIAVFVSDSSANEKIREAVIAKITKAVWEKWKG